MELLKTFAMVKILKDIHCLGRVNVALSFSIVVVEL